MSAEPTAPPRYAETRPSGPAGTWQVVAAPDPEGAPLPLRQDARIASLRFDHSTTATYPLAGRTGYLYLAEGSATVNGQPLAPGDALELVGEPSIELTGGTAGQAVLFDLATA